MTAVEVPRTRRDDGDGSCFDSVVVDMQSRVFAPPTEAFDVSEPIAVDELLFFSVPAGYVGDWHPSPHNQFYVQMSGALEVTVSSGERRTFRAGDVLWVTDTDGIGHQSRVVGSEPSVGCFVQLPNSAPDERDGAGD